MSDNNTNAPKNSGVPGHWPGNAPRKDSTTDPWNDEPTWPGTEYDDEKALADEMSDDDNDPPWPWASPAFGFQQQSVWDEALDKIFASKAPGGSA